MALEAHRHAQTRRPKVVATVTARRAGNKTRRRYVVLAWGDDVWSDGGRTALVRFGRGRKRILLYEIKAV